MELEFNDRKEKMVYKTEEYIKKKIGRREIAISRSPKGNKCIRWIK